MSAFTADAVSAVVPFHTVDDGTYGFKIYLGGRWGKNISHGQSLHKVFTSKEDAMNVIEKTILFFRDQGLKGERFALTIERLGFDTVEEAILSSDELLDRKEEILSKEL